MGLARAGRRRGPAQLAWPQCAIAAVLLLCLQLSSPHGSASRAGLRRMAWQGRAAGRAPARGMTLVLRGGGEGPDGGQPEISASDLEALQKEVEKLRCGAARALPSTRPSALHSVHLASPHKSMLAPPRAVRLHCSSRASDAL
jgi:hypothetical protein